MPVESERQSELIDRMLEARTPGEVEAAGRDAERWMVEHPQDLQVVAAREHLARTADRLGDPDRRVRRLGWAVLAFVFVAGTYLIGSATGHWALAVGSALLLGEGLAYVVWAFGGAPRD